MFPLNVYKNVASFNLKRLALQMFMLLTYHSVNYNLLSSQCLIFLLKMSIFGLLRFEQLLFGSNFAFTMVNNVHDISYNISTGS